jgi:mRNA interferase MazF
LNTGLAQTIVAMITSNMTRAGHPGRVIVAVGGETARGSGLLMDFVVTTDNLATIHDSEIDRIIGHFTRIIGHFTRIIGHFTRMDKIDEALRTTLAL